MKSAIWADRMAPNDKSRKKATMDTLREKLRSSNYNLHEVEALGVYKDLSKRN